MELVNTLTRDDVLDLAARYGDLGDGEARAAGGRIAEGHGTMDDALVLVRWKSPRPLARFRRNAFADVEIACRSAIMLARAGDDVGAIWRLTLLEGVQPRMASAFLCWLLPESFPVLDVRALETLGVPGTDVGAICAGPRAVGEYVRFCRAEASRLDVTLRTLDRALWQHSKEGAARA